MCVYVCLDLQSNGLSIELLLHYTELSFGQVCFQVVQW